MRHFLLLSSSAAALFLGGSTWLVFYPPVPVDLAGAQNLDAQAERVTIPVADGDLLHGWHVPSRNGATILLLHGYGRDHTRAWRYGGFLKQAGYGLLAFDFRSSRMAGRVPTTLGYYELADAQAALDWLRARPGAGGRIGVLGESLGGSVGLQLAAGNPDVRAVVADCAFSTGRQALEDACERWAHLPRWPTAGLIRALARTVTGHDPGALDAVAAAHSLRDRPVLFIHSLRDNRLSPMHPRALWQAAGAKDPLWEIPDAGHNEGWKRHRTLYESRVRVFYEKHLLGRGAGLPSGAL